ncbi:hypothetical protein IDM40_18090 [Nocardiopsis sp. HNM0947]|uniref:Uncharacterized protein n=1 Tax=Nocardiopsis coralli TaxID=2772213 RepID=A0ABR9P9S2_9ACTN|nr:hypothetical protein [Nocardiopsis coralli]MBE3000595.1 hypothetical protein [Nocardiopsis coralli]
MEHEQSGRAVSGSRRWPAAAWWAPLLFDLAGLQRANPGSLLSRVDLAGADPAGPGAGPDRSGAAPGGARSLAVRPRITVSRDGHPETRFECAPEPGPDALLAALRADGPAEPAPADHGTVFWDPGAEAGPAERHAFLLDELSSSSGAWSRRADEPFDLLGLTVHADRAATDLWVGRPRRGDALVLRLPALAPVDMIGLTYGLVEHLWGLDAEGLPEAPPLAGLPAHLVHMR